MASRTPSRLLVIVSPGESAVATVEYALREARDARAERDAAVSVTVLVLDGPARDSTAARTRIEAAVSEFGPRDGLDVAVEVLPTGEGDPTEDVLARVDVGTVSRVVLNPGSDVSVASLGAAFGPTRVETAPASGDRPRRRLVHAGGVRRLATLFVLAYGFYLAIGGFTPGLDVLTGAISAAVVALSLSHVVLREEPRLGRTGGRLLRLLPFVPALLWEIVKANVAIAYVILHPRLPIDPSMGTLETATREGLERMVLANSITLTPGTLAVDVREGTFTIHSLTAGAREDVAGGRLERLVAWVFHGERDGGEDR